MFHLNFFQLFLKLLFALAKIVAVRTMFVALNRNQKAMSVFLEFVLVTLGYRNFSNSCSPSSIGIVQRATFKGYITITISP